LKSGAWARNKSARQERDRSGHATSIAMVCACRPHRPKIFREKLDVFSKRTNQVLAKIFDDCRGRFDALYKKDIEEYAPRIRADDVESVVVGARKRRARRNGCSRCAGPPSSPRPRHLSLVTSSNPVEGCLHGCGLGRATFREWSASPIRYNHARRRRSVPDRDQDEIADDIIRRGARRNTPGRRRRVGWFDAVIERGGGLNSAERTARPNRTCLTARKA